MCVCLGISIENGCIYVHKEVKLGNKIIWAVDPLLSPKRPLVRYSMCIDNYSEIDLVFSWKYLIRQYTLSFLACIHVSSLIPQGHRHFNNFLP